MALFQKGNQLGKRKGKHASGPAKLAARVRRITKDGRLILDTAVAIMKDPKSRAMEKVKAAELLKESGWGLASRGGDVESSTGNILIHVIRYDDWRAGRQKDSTQKPSEGTETQPSNEQAKRTDEELAPA